MSTVSFIIITYNSAGVIEACINGLHAGNAHDETEIIVVDNASNDGTAELIQQKFPAATLIRNQENIGFARAVNQGAKIASGEFLFLLNPDTIPEPGACDTLLTFMNLHPEIGAAAPRILHVDGKLQASVWNVPDFGSLLIEMALPHIIALRLTDRTPRSAATPVEVQTVSGAAIMLRKECFTRLTGLDERFFMYYEDIDFCVRLKTEGLDIMFVPAATVRHYQGESSKRDLGRFLNIFYKSKLAYWKKHAPQVDWVLARKIILRGLLWKRVFYAFLGTILLNADLRKLGKMYGETRQSLLEYQ